MDPEITTTISDESKMKSLFDRTENMERFTIIWLHRDATSRNKDHSKYIRAQLRDIIDYLQTFDKVVDCENYIKKTKYETIFFIISSEFVQEIVPNIHDIKSIYAIYIYSNDNITIISDNEQKNYKKIKGTYLHTLELFNQLMIDLKIETKNIINSSILDKSTRNYDESLWYLLFLHIVVHNRLFEPTANQRAILIEKCKLYYSGNKTQEKFIDEFDQTYKSNEAIQWYTRSSFLFNILNKALRQQDMITIAYFRFFISDLYQQVLHRTTNNTNVNGDESTVYYRGQLMSLDEIKELEELVGHDVVVCSFFSTTNDRDVAKAFGGVGTINSNEEIQSVLFQIEIQKTKGSFTMYADISSFSQFSDELEILFLPGTIFNIKHIVFDSTENYWTVHFILAHIWPDSLRNIVMSPISFNAKLLKFDLISQKHNSIVYEKLEQYYNILLRDLSLTLSCKITCYTGIGRIAYKKNMYDIALSVLLKALDLYKEFVETTAAVRILSAPDYWKSRFPIPQGCLSEPEEVIAYTYQYLADVYKEKYEYTLAIKNYELAIDTRLLLTPIDEGPVIGCIFSIIISCLSSGNTKKPLDIGKTLISSRNFDIHFQIRLDQMIELFFGESRYLLHSVDISYDFDKDKTYFIKNKD